MKLVREKPGVVGDRACWVLIDRPYLYMHTSLVGLLLQVVCGWRSDQHLVG